MTIILYKLAQFFLVLFLGYGLACGGIIEERDLALLSRLVTKVLLFTALFYLVLGTLLASLVTLPLAAWLVL